MSPEYAAEWIQKAQADRTAAKRALRDARSMRGQADIACFHAQQCAEKHLKTILAKNREPVPHVHDLVALAGLAGRFGFPASAFLAQARLLNRHAVRVRYPGLSATAGDAGMAVAAMDAVVRASRKLLSK